MNYPNDGTLLLRQMTLEDVQDHLAGEDKEIVKYCSGGKSTTETVTNWIIKTVQENLAGGPKLTFGIALVETNKLVGMIEISTNLADIEFLENGQGNIAYSIYPNYRNKRYATRAVNLLCKHANPTIYVKTAIIRTNPQNIPSEQVALGAGFTYIGTKQSSEGTLKWFTKKLL